MTALDTGQFMALMTIAQRHGRPGTPTHQAHVESLFSHLNGDWPHLTRITDPAALDTELAGVRHEDNSVWVHAAIGYVTPDDERRGRGPRIRRARTAGIRRARGVDQARSSEDVMSHRAHLAPSGEEGRF
jgi:putative transposase